MVAASREIKGVFDLGAIVREKHYAHTVLRGQIVLCRRERSFRQSVLDIDKEE